MFLLIVFCNNRFCGTRQPVWTFGGSSALPAIAPDSSCSFAALPFRIKREKGLWSPVLSCGKRQLSGYHVYRAQQREVFANAITEVTSTGAATAAFEDDTGANGTTYDDRVTAVGEAGNESAASNQAEGTLPAASPSRP